MLAVKGLSKSFGGLKAVDNVSMEVPENVIIGLIGPNGSGKSTIFNLITGFYKPDAGEIELQGESICGLAPHQIARKGLVRTFQQTRVFPEMTVFENMIVAAQDIIGENVFDPMFRRRIIKLDQKKKSDKALELLEFAGLYKRRDEYAKNLAYGEQKRLELVRAVMTDPKVLLLDEPTAGVSRSHVSKMQEYILGLQKTGITFVIIEHHMKFVMGLSQYVYVLDHGQVISQGTPTEVQNDPKVIEAYLGEEADAQTNMNMEGIG